MILYSLKVASDLVYKCVLCVCLCMCVCLWCLCVRVCMYVRAAILRMADILPHAVYLACLVIWSMVTSPAGLRLYGRDQAGSQVAMRYL